MKKENKHVARLGLFVIVAVTLFILGFYLIGNNQNMFGKTFHLTTTFENVNGLKKGNVVRFNGIDVGTIWEINFLNDSTLQVNMRIEKKVQTYIKKNAVASIGSEGLVGNMLVNISPGGEGQPPVMDGDEISSYSRIETEDILSTLGNTNENIAIISKNLLDISEKMNSGEGVIANLLDNKTLSEDLLGTVHHLHQTVTVLQTTSQQLNALLAQVQEGEGLAGRIIKDTVLLPTLIQSARKLDTAITGLNGLVTGADPVIENLHQTSKNLTSASANLESLIVSVDRGEGSVSALLHDPQLRQDLQQTLHNLQEGTARFSEDMEALKHNIFFRKYFKNQAKANQASDQ